MIKKQSKTDQEIQNNERSTLYSAYISLGFAFLAIAVLAIGFTFG